MSAVGLREGSQSQRDVADMQTRRLMLVPKSVEEVRARVPVMSAGERAELSARWLAQLDGEPDVWTLGFTIVHRDTNTVVGGCGFKGPPGADHAVEIAYGIVPDHQGRGFATEAAEALVAYAFGSNKVRLVRAHTFELSNASARVLTKCGFVAVGEVIEPDDGHVFRWERQDF